MRKKKPLEICFSHVSFSHPGGDKRILDDVSFTLHAGEHTALVGINGAGKSTIVKLICGLYQPTEGNITINGIPLGSLNPAQYYKAIAAVFQDPFALSFSIAENVSCSPLEETDRNRCREALIRAGLWEKIASLPQKEETYLGKDMADDGITLSGGEMQKLMMARALYKNCHLLLLDEPTAALDAISENKMYETYSTLLKNKTALFISHRLASTRFCDTILFLENGKIKECGTHDELIALGGSYAHMFEVQSQYYQETGGRYLMKMKERFHAICRFLTMVSQGNHRVLFWLLGSAFAAATLPYLSLFFSARILNLLLAKSYRACLYTVVVFLLTQYGLGLFEKICRQYLDGQKELCLARTEQKITAKALELEFEKFEKTETMDAIRRTNVSSMGSGNVGDQLIVIHTLITSLLSVLYALFFLLRLFLLSDSSRNNFFTSPFSMLALLLLCGVQLALPPASTAGVRRKR